jgi:hypothetical protein
MGLTTNQKVAVGVVLLAVLTVLILWWTGIIFKSKFSRTKRSGMNFGNNSSFGAVNRRSRFGAIGSNREGDMTHRIQTSVTYRNPENFGLWYSPGTVGQAQSTAAKFVGLMFHMSSTTNNDGMTASTDNGTNARSGLTTKDPVNYGTLTSSNDFFTNVYLTALASYYGANNYTGITPGTSNFGYENVSSAYKEYIDAGESTWFVVQTAVQFAFSQVNPLATLGAYNSRSLQMAMTRLSINPLDARYDLAAQECIRLQILLLSFVKDTQIIGQSPGVNTGIWKDKTGQTSSGGVSAEIETTQNLSWLSKPYGDYTFGVAIINTALTLITTTSDSTDRYKFPLSVSDLNIANAHVSGLPSVSNSPTGLSVTVTYY